MHSSSWFEVNCHPAFRPSRQWDRRIIVLPDGNHRKHGPDKYHGGADNVVACAERLARRGDVSRLLACVVSPQNAEKRPDSFFLALEAEFLRLRDDIAAGRALAGRDIRCHARGDLEPLRAAGKPHAGLVAAVEAACAETRGIERPRLDLEFWLSYSNLLAWEEDVDLVVRTGAEEPDAIRPGFWLPPSVPCIVTTSLWPDASPDEIEALVSEGLAGRSSHFAPGYDLAFVAELLRALPPSRIPAPFRLTMPICAPAEGVLAMLERMYADSAGEPLVFASYTNERGAPLLELGPREDAWYALRLVPAAYWAELASEPFSALLAPGQSGRKATLATAVGAASVFTCDATTEGLLEALGHAVQYPARHVMLGGADRSAALSLADRAPWPADVMELVWACARRPDRTAGELAQERLPAGGSEAREHELIVFAMAAKVLASALAEGLLQRDASVRRADLNYACTGAAMMQHVPDETNPTGLDWEPAAELAIRCMLTLSTGDNGIFDRVLEGEGDEAWRARLESAASFLSAVARGDAPVELPGGPGARVVGVVGQQWKGLFERHAEANPDLVKACRDALARHYQANIDEYAVESPSASLVARLALGGEARREAIAHIDERYAKRAPAPVAERMRSLSQGGAGDPRGSGDGIPELELLLHIADTANGMGIEVLFSFCALPTPAAFVTPPRLAALVELGRLADCAFRLANDMASLEESGEDRDSRKKSSISILIPEGASGSSLDAARERARRVGGAALVWLYEHLGRAASRLFAEWPSMAEKAERAMRIGRGVYERAHYATTSAKEMIALVERVTHALGATSKARRSEASGFGPAAPAFDRKIA